MGAKRVSKQSVRVTAGNAIEVTNASDAVVFSVDNAGTINGAVSATELGYLDGVTSAVQTQMDAKLGTTTASTTYQSIANNFAAGKNKIINGDFGIWQRGTSFSNPASGIYCADRFKTIHNGTGATRTVSQQTFTVGTAPVAGYEGQYFMRYAVSVAGSSNTFQGMNQYIEDVRTFAGQTVTVSFWAKADASRTVNVDLTQNFGSGGSSTVFVSLSVASAAVTTSWQRFTFTGTVASIAGKTIGTGSALVFGYYAPAATVSTIDIWGVQIEAGSDATPFQTATGTIQGELAACQLYYWRGSTTNSYGSWGGGSASSTTQVNAIIPLPVQMRTSPSAVDFSTLRVNDTAAAYIVTGLTLSGDTSANTALVNATVASGLTQFRYHVLQNNNSTAGYIGFTAELQEMTMDNVTFIKVTGIDGEVEHAIIDRGNGEFTSMTKAEYDRQQAELNN